MNLVSFSNQVLKINLIGHRKRILASLGDRLHEDTPQKPPRATSLRVSLSACAHVEKPTVVLKVWRWSKTRSYAPYAANGAT